MTIRSPGAALLLLAAASACGRDDTARLALLFLNRSPAATLGGLAWAPDLDHSRLVAFDDALRPVKTVTGPWLAQPVAVSPMGPRLLVTELTGDAVVVDTAGRLVREWPSVFAVSLYAGGTASDRVAAVRSPYRVPTLLPEAEGAPLVQMLDTLGRPTEGLASIRVPRPPFLTQFVNAGAVALAADGAVYFAPLTRDEIRKYDANGVLAWTATRGLHVSRADPTYVARLGSTGAVEVAHVAANVALVLGPDGRLYALGATDSAGTRLRLDVLDPATGSILVSRALDSTETAVALRPDGSIFTADARRLLAGTAPAGREPFAPPFALPDALGGRDTVRLADYAGKVTLVNFWASWCDPCREEFPHMGTLYREFDRKDFDIAAISDDVDRRAMLEFAREFRPPFPLLAGGGRMKQAYHYRGLPYSVLLDRRGRIVQRIFGFGGPAAFTRLHKTIANEIASP